MTACATVFNLEGEYAVGYTRIAGEWIMDSFETASAPAVARGYLARGGPHAHAAMVYGGPHDARDDACLRGRRSRPQERTAPRTPRSATALTPEITLKAGYQGSRTYTRVDWDHAAAVSIVFGRSAGGNGRVLAVLARRWLAPFLPGRPTVPTS